MFNLAEIAKNYVVLLFQSDGLPSEHLHHTFIWTVNQQICQQNYEEMGFVVTANMICAGWLNIGERGQCAEDSGGPLIYYNETTNIYAVIGVNSFNHYCAHPRFVGINTRVSPYIAWIQNTV